MSIQAKSVFENRLFAHHYAQRIETADYGRYQVRLTVEVREIDGNKRFVAQKINGQSGLVIQSDFAEIQTVWLASTYDEAYVSNLVVDMLEYIDMAAEGHTLPTHKDFGQEIFHADVCELHLGNFTMRP